MKWLLIIGFSLGLVVAVHGGAIHDAARDGDLERVRALVNGTPASVNLRDRGTTPLHEAARGGHLAVVKFLIEKGANVNGTDISGSTPLRLALGYRHEDVAALLRQKGALLEKAVAAAPPKPAMPPEAVASAPRADTRPLPPGSVTPSAPAIPVPRAIPPTNTAVGATNAPPPREMLALIYPIHEAARIGDAEQIKYLLRSFPDLIEATDEKSMTPLHIAAANKQLAAAQTLVGLHAKVNARSDTGQTPLHYAARAGDLRIVSLLLTNRAEVNARDIFDLTPLLAATQPTDKEEFQAVDVSGGVRFNAAQKRTAIIEMHQQQLALAHYLITRGADVNARTRVGATALLQAVRLRNASLVDLLLQRGADPNAVDSAGQVTALHIAAGRGLTNLVTSLVQARARLNVVDSRGETPLGYALREGHRDVAAILKQHGANMGPARVLTGAEQGLVDFYQRTEASLQRASAADKTRLMLEMTATKSDVEKIFPRHAEAGVRVMEEIRRQIKAHKPVGDAEQGKEIWRVRPEPPSLQAQDWINRGWISRDVPVSSLVVDRVGATTRPGDYCFVNRRWILLPPLAFIAAQQPSAAIK
jgi:ankyrin repeat protein